MPEVELPAEIQEWAAPFRETRWGRTWSRFRKPPESRGWIGFGMIEAVFSAAGGVGTAFFLPTDPHLWERLGVGLAGAAIGFGLGFLLILFGRLATEWWRAPIDQRDEARQEAARWRLDAYQRDSAGIRVWAHMEGSRVGVRVKNYGSEESLSVGIEISGAGVWDVSYFARWDGVPTDTRSLRKDAEDTAYFPRLSTWDDDQSRMQYGRFQRQRLELLKANGESSMLPVDDGAELEALVTIHREGNKEPIRGVYELHLARHSGEIWLGRKDVPMVLGASSRWVLRT